jgi:acetyltransferase-like isoleucine patch superfamily enzyme
MTGLLLYVRRIRIGDGVLLGAGSRLGPGVRIEDGAVLPVRTDVGVGRRIRSSP